MKPVKLILASASPRRKELLSRFENVEFEVMPADADEAFDSLCPPEQIAMSLAVLKAMHILDKYTDAVVLGADTLVVADGVILGKPLDFDDAVSMFKRLCGKSHKVCTGVCIASKQKIVKDFALTDVTFGAFNEEIVYNYIRSGKSYDKAGGYGIQDEELKPLIARVDGDITNVIGLPLKVTKDLLKEIF